MDLVPHEQRLFLPIPPSHPSVDKIKPLVLTHSTPNPQTSFFPPATGWFPVKERDIATSLASMLNPIGIAVGQVLPSLLTSFKAATGDGGDGDGDSGHEWSWPQADGSYAEQPETAEGMPLLLMVQFIHAGIALLLALAFLRNGWAVVGRAGDAVLLEHSEGICVCVCARMRWCCSCFVRCLGSWIRSMCFSALHLDFCTSL